ncbi:MAG: hypothetical protein LV481_04685 [Methylacidiphilales bacterium]|nr:hypothetical protein [Candidatus Methylacidiphilales bacterium]
MITQPKAQCLIDFETEAADLFNAAKICAPIHLYSGNCPELEEAKILRLCELLNRL